MIRAELALAAIALVSTGAVASAQAQTQTTLEHLYRLRDAFSMTSPSHSARTPLRATMNRCNLRRLYA
jgi:hypothetical protein